MMSCLFSIQMIVTMMTLTVTMETVYLPVMSAMETMTVETTVTKKTAVINPNCAVIECQVLNRVSIVGSSPT